MLKRYGIGRGGGRRLETWEEDGGRAVEIERKKERGEGEKEEDVRYV